MADTQAITQVATGAEMAGVKTMSEDVETRGSTRQRNAVACTGPKAGRTLIETAYN